MRNFLLILLLLSVASSVRLQLRKGETTRPFGFEFSSSETPDEFSSSDITQRTPSEKERHARGSEVATSESQDEVTESERQGDEVTESERQGDEESDERSEGNATSDGSEEKERPEDQKENEEGSEDKTSSDGLLGPEEKVDTSIYRAKELTEKLVNPRSKKTCKEVSWTEKFGIAKGSPPVYLPADEGKFKPFPPKAAEALGSAHADPAEITEIYEPADPMIKIGMAHRYVGDMKFRTSLAALMGSDESKRTKLTEEFGSTPPRLYPRRAEVQSKMSELSPGQVLVHSSAYKWGCNVFTQDCIIDCREESPAGDLAGHQVRRGYQYRMYHKDAKDIPSPRYTSVISAGLLSKDPATLVRAVEISMEAVVQELRSRKSAVSVIIVPHSSLMGLPESVNPFRAYKKKLDDVMTKEGEIPDEDERVLKAPRRVEFLIADNPRSMAGDLALAHAGSWNIVAVVPVDPGYLNVLFKFYGLAKTGFGFFSGAWRSAVAGALMDGGLGYAMARIVFDKTSGGHREAIRRSYGIGMERSGYYPKLQFGHLKSLVSTDIPAPVK